MEINLKCIRNVISEVVRQTRDGRVSRLWVDSDAVLAADEEQIKFCDDLRESDGQRE